MIHKFGFWFGADSNPNCIQIGLTRRVTSNFMFYDSKVYHWFYSYFEGLVYTYWEELDLQRTTEWDSNRSDQVLRTKIILLCSSMEEPSV